MKKMRKMVSLLIAAVMMLAMTLPASASSYKITINGAQQGGEYKAYKVFDATVSESEKAVSYTIPEGSGIAGVDGFNNVFETTQNGGKTYVTVKAGVSEADVIAWLKANENAITAGTPAAEATNSSGASSVTLDVGAAGYYFITSTVGTKSAVEVTSAKPTAEVNDKTETSPSVTPESGKKINGKDVNDMQVGETANFTVQFTATNYATDAAGNTTAINSYTVIDTPNGFAINKDSVTVKVNGAAYAIDGKQVSTSIDGTTGVLTVTIPWDQTTYPSPSTVVVSYSAELTNKNLAGTSSNKAEIKYNDTTIPGGNPETKTYNYTVKVTKIDADTKYTLAGAQFVLKNSENNFYAVDANGVVSWVTAQNQATVVTTNADGIAEFAGLAHGTYTLVETKAPDGYNLAANQTVTLEEITTEITDTSILTVNATVEDKAGSILPSTGGMGTTLIYVIGAVLVIGAGIVLVTRKRTRA